MADLDKVLKGLECCANSYCAGSDCPYFAEKDCDILKMDALELLKAQQTEIAFLKPHYEPRKPNGIHIWHHGYIGHCPSCDRVVDFAERFCHNCTQLLDWSEVLEMPSENDDD